MKLKVFTAFSGYDSQCMALDRIGIDYELVGWSEIDKYAIKAHNAIYPMCAEKNFGDISKIDWNEVPEFDLFTYSFPCQDISNAGNRKGLEEGSGTRSSLLWECKKAIEAKRPKYLVMENVKALTSIKFLPFLEKWESYLGELGYTNSRAVLNSKCYGVPQNRERTFVVSILEAPKYTFPQPFELQKRLYDVLESSVDERYYLREVFIDEFNIHNNIHDKKSLFCLSEERRDTYEHTNCMRENIYSRSIDNTIKYECLNTDKEGNAACIKADYYKMGKANFLHHSNDGFRATCVKVYGTGPSPFYNGKTIEFLDKNHNALPFRIRKLTPKECFRLMGVSEDNINKIQQSGISNSQQYKLAGNSIVVDVLYCIFKELFLGGGESHKKRTCSTKPFLIWIIIEEKLFALSVVTKWDGNLMRCLRNVGMKKKEKLYNFILAGIAALLWN